MHAIALNMFGVETVDYALALAEFTDNPSSVLSQDGTVVLVAHEKTTPLPSGTIKKAQFVYRVVNKWVELYEIRQMWLNVPKKIEEAKARCTTNTTPYFLTSYIPQRYDNPEVFTHGTRTFLSCSSYWLDLLLLRKLYKEAQSRGILDGRR